MEKKRLKEFLFNRPEATNPVWYFSPDFDEPNFNNLSVVQNIAEVFRELTSSFDDYTYTQIANGLHYLTSTSASDLPYLYFKKDIPELDRLNVLESMYSVFEKVFQFHCEETCSHMSESDNPLNGVCYMWWDNLPRHGLPYSKDYEMTDSLLLKIFTKLLQLDHIACKEASLHALGHWYVSYPDEVENIIISNKAYVPEALLEYSERAMVGYVQ